MNSPSKTFLLFLIVLGCFNLCIGDITDLPGEAICAAQCLANFSQSLDKKEQKFLSQRPDLTEPHCLKKQSNCSLCLDVCRWSLQNISLCDSSCFRIANNAVKTFPNSPFEVHRQTCQDACIFSQISHTERAAVVSGFRPATCPLPSSWPDGATCLHPQVCMTDTDCGRISSAVVKCCRMEECGTDGLPQPPSTLYRFARGGEQLPGFCMLVSNDTVFENRGVPPVPGPPSVRQTALVSGVQEEYQLELDWQEYYDINRPSDSLEWNSPAVFLVQARFFHNLDDSGFGDNGAFGDDLLLDELFGEWRSLVWTTKVGAVLSDLNPDTWCQFRLKAASGTGFGGNGRPSRPIKVMTLPEAPRNLSEGPSRISSKTVEVQVNWEPPPSGSAPIKYYRINWTKYDRWHIEDQSLETYKMEVPRTVLTFTFRDLEPEAIYKVEVTAVAVVDGREWSSPPARHLIRTVKITPKDNAYNSLMQHHNREGSSCQCGVSSERQHFIQNPFFEDGNLKTRLMIPRHFLTQYFGSDVQENTIFRLNWFPLVCIETPNSKARRLNPSSMMDVSTPAFSGTIIKGLRFQCHYKLQIEIVTEIPPHTSTKVLELCFCTPSCMEVLVKSGLSPRNCSYADTLIPHQPIDIRYRLTPTIETNQQHPTMSGGSIASSQSEFEPVFPVRNMFKIDPNQLPGFDALISWKPHPEMIVGGDTGRYSEHTVTGSRPAYNTRLQSRGYRIIWGPRLVEPIEPDMYSNGIAPQLDPEKTESKVVDSKVHNVILRNLEQDTLYIVQVQTIGVHGDSPVNAVFFTTPSLRKDIDTDLSRALQSSWTVWVSSLFLTNLFQWTSLR